MARRRRGILEELVELPWWASIVAAGIVYLGARWIVPWISGSQGVGRSLAAVSIACAPYLAILFLLPAPFAVLREWKDRQQVEAASDWDFVQRLSWQEFEHLLVAAYRRLGFDVEARGGAGADGGIDIVLKEPGKTTLVQCKHWIPGM